MPGSIPNRGYFMDWIGTALFLYGMGAVPFFRENEYPLNKVSSVSPLPDYLVPVRTGYGRTGGL